MWVYIHTSEHAAIQSSTIIMYCACKVVWNYTQQKNRKGLRYSVMQRAGSR